MHQIIEQLIFYELDFLRKYAIVKRNFLNHTLIAAAVINSRTTFGITTYSIAKNFATTESIIVVKIYKASNDDCNLSQQTNRKYRDSNFIQHSLKYVQYNSLLEQLMEFKELFHLVPFSSSSLDSISYMLLIFANLDRLMCMVRNRIFLNTNSWLIVKNSDSFACCQSMTLSLYQYHAQQRHLSDSWLLQEARVSHERSLYCPCRDLFQIAVNSRDFLLIHVKAFLIMGILELQANQLNL